MHSEVEIILVGDDAGTVEACKELGLLHVKDVKRNSYGTKYLTSVFNQAAELARHKILCYVNCDIILMSDFRRALERVTREHEGFLMAGRRWDADVQEPLDLEKSDWEARLRKVALETNRQRPPQWIDYFAFPKGLYSGQLPDFFIGRPGWDNWLLWYPLSIGVPVVDASKVVLAVHQNHDYSYHPDGEEGVWRGAEAQHNYALLKTQGEYETLESASYALHERGIRRSYRRIIAKGRRDLADLFYSVWFALLDATRPFRHDLGLRSRPKQKPVFIIGLVITLILFWVWEVFTHKSIHGY